MSRVRPERRGYAKLNYEQHLERLKNMKPTVEFGPGITSATEIRNAITY